MYNVTIVEPGFIAAVKVTAGITSILSILGASLIIFTYIAFRNLRTTARQLLVTLSVADIIVAASHFLGLFVNFERFIKEYNNETWNTSTTDPLCISQAAFSVFGTLASFLLSLAIGVYLVGLLISKNLKKMKRLVPFIYIICLSIPAILIIPSFVLRCFGFTLGADIGWCYIAQKANSSDPNFRNYTIAEYLSYDVWVYLVYIILPVLYFSAFIYVRFKRWKSKYKQLNTHLPQESVDIKLLLVPVLFLLLRIWSTILNLLIFHGTGSTDDDRLKKPGIAALVIMAGIGDNAQGLVNALLFCVFTKQVRKQLFSKEYYMSACGGKKIQPTSAVDENTAFKNDRQFYNDTSVSYTHSVQNVHSVTQKIELSP